MDPESAAFLTGHLSPADINDIERTTAGAAVGHISGMKGLSATNQLTGKALGIAVGALAGYLGTAAILSALTAAEETRKLKLAAEAAVLTAANATNPAGWGRIALAAAVAATAGFALAAIVNNVRLGPFDLSTSQGRYDAVSAVEEVI